MEYVTHIHTGADGVVQMTVPDEWADKDVTITLKTTPSETKDNTIEDLEACFTDNVPQAPVLTLEDMTRETIYGLR